jgi:hypothetical protein
MLTTSGGIHQTAWSRPSCEWHEKKRNHPMWAGWNIIMSEKRNGGHCWVVRWRREDEASVLQHFLHVLPWRWNSEKVEEYLLSLHYNSPMMPVSERIGWMNSEVRLGLVVVREKERVIVGEHPYLVANLVTDLSVTYDATRGVETLSYSEPRGTRFDIEGGKVLRNSSPVNVSLELPRPSGL